MPPKRITSKKQEEHWYALSVSDCFKKLKSAKGGLTNKEAQSRQKSHGSNTISSEKSFSRLAVFFSQLKSPLVYVLLAAGLISVFLGDLTDASVIFFAVIINTIFGFWQENKVNRAITQLRKIIRHNAKVLRGGHEIEISSAEIVPGDIIFLKSGDKVPADCRVIESKDLQTTEAALTGESTPSSKNNKILKMGTYLAERKNMVYMGTIIARGMSTALVCETGLNTEIGQITKLIKETKEEPTPLQKSLSKFSAWLTVLVVSLSSVIFFVGVLLNKDPLEMFITAVALAVAAIPEGLIIAVTIILTIGMQFILKKKALVRKLVATETLGSVSVICTDKTGTLTEGKMQVSNIITADKEYKVNKSDDLSEIEKARDLILKISILCNDAVAENPESALEELKIIGSPTEKALLMAALESGYEEEKIHQEYTEIDEIPFDSEKKFMATLHHHKKMGHSHIFVKGAPEVIFKYCHKVMIDGRGEKLTADKLKYLRKKYETATSKGLRLLSFAYKTGTDFKNCAHELNNLVFLGFVAIKDPLRPEAKEALNLCKLAGIRPVIITGDHKLTAKAIFEELGFKTDGNIVEGKDMDDWTDEELQKRVATIDVYARVKPSHKLRVVDAWQARGEVVAMTGDGVNDAPALKSADIGIALGEGSDVTKETADIILLDNNFKVIVSAVEQGRIIFENIRKVILYLLSSSFSEIVLIIGSLLVGLPLPILATQILWINLVADGLPSIAMTLEPGEPEIMKDRPRKKTESILNREMKILIFIIGVVTDIVPFIFYVFFIYLMGQENLDYIRTIMFATIGVGSLMYIFSVRSLRRSIFTKNIFSNKYLIGAVVIALFVLVIPIYTPFLQGIFKTVSLGLNDWLIIFALGLVKLVFIEIAKYYFIVRTKNKPKKQLPLKKSLPKLITSHV
ncbi:MAG: HAD-IC family P-type ATPase [Candidatus Buchananbacteria bacterium]|nr:HAD-IC family P-type ATPase [Candidatus Buchananbacteria bacterium]